MAPRLEAVMKKLSDHLRAMEKEAPRLHEFMHYTPAVAFEDGFRAAIAEVAPLVEALDKIANRPDLPNPECDADWKNCMKNSSYEARAALAKWNGGE
jgi:hypothetical protein